MATVEDLWPHRGFVVMTSGALYNAPLDIMQRIMSQLIIIRAFVVPSNNTFEYQALCPSFRPLKEGEMAPTYKCIITTTPEGTTLIGWEEAKQ